MNIECDEGKIRTQMKMMKEMKNQPGIRSSISSELWHACAGPLVALPQVGTLVYYFPQGHVEQIAFSTRGTTASQIPNYNNLPSQLLCQVQKVSMHADKESDEIYAQISLQPVSSERDVISVPEVALRSSHHPSDFFCKTLTASDTSTHGGFSVPRRAAEKLFPPLDYAAQPPTQELLIRDLHNNIWTFRHIYRGQPKRHLLTTGWSLFVGSKRLKAGDAVIFVRDENSQLMVGVRRACRQQTSLPSSVLSADSMHIGVLAAAAHASATHTPFKIYYNPRACPSDFVIPVKKYRKALYATRISCGMRFGMMFETEESNKRRFMGTIVGISDLDPLRWPGSKWRNLHVEWDEPGCYDKQIRVSPWEMDTPESLLIFPSLTSGLKRSAADTNWWSRIRSKPYLAVEEHLSEFRHRLPDQTALLDLEQKQHDIQANASTSTNLITNSILLNQITIQDQNAWLVDSFSTPNQIDLSQLDDELQNPSVLQEPIIPDWNQLDRLPPLAQDLQAFDYFPNLSSSSMNADRTGIYDSDLRVESVDFVDYPLSCFFDARKDSDVNNPSDCLTTNFCSSQDGQSQLTSFGASSSNVDADDCSLFQNNNNSWQNVPPPVRTYTKVQKTGSVGRSIDVSGFRNYVELRSAIEGMFGLDGLLNEGRNSGWKLVYVDYENDVLLVGDDPWEEFVACVRCIRILSPTEVQRMSQDGMQLNSTSFPVM